MFKSRRTGVKPDLAALLRGEVDDLLLPLDTGSSRVTWTWFGDWSLCEMKADKHSWVLVTNRLFGTEIYHPNDSTERFYSSILSFAYFASMTLMLPGRLQHWHCLHSASTVSMNTLPVIKTNAYQTYICPQTNPCWLCLFRAICATWEDVYLSRSETRSTNGTVV